MENEEKKDVKKNKIVLYSVIGGIISVVAILAIVLIIILTNGKPSKKVSKKLVEDFVEAVNDKDGDAFAELIDVKGYVIFNEEKESKFNEKYKKKDEYFNKYKKKNDFDDTDDVIDSISTNFENSISQEFGGAYTKYECKFKDIESVKKSKKSSKIYTIKAKVKVSAYSKDTTKALRLYTVKDGGKYKIVGYEFVK